MTNMISCPACETGKLRPDPFLVRCSGCDYALSRDYFKTLRQITALPEARTAAPSHEKGRSGGGDEGVPGAKKRGSGRARGERDY